MSTFRRLPVACGLAAGLIGFSPDGAIAQAALSGTVLSGNPLANGAAGSTRLVLGARVASPTRSWTEIAFSDGSSIVLGPGAEMVIRQIAAGPGSARTRISATGSGEIRIVAMDGVDVDLNTADAAITVIAADAVVRAVPHGSVAMMGGREVVVAQRSRRDTLRRPGFSVPLDGAGPRRDDDRQLLAAMAPFGSSGPAEPPAAQSTASSASAAPVRARPARRGLTPAAVASLPSPTEVAAAGSAGLTTGLTAQSGSLTASLARVSAPTSAVSVTSGATATTTTTTITTVPDLNYASFNSTPSVGTGLPTSPDTTPTPAPTAPPSFVPVDGTLLATIRGTAGPITLPGTTTSVSAGLVPSNEHLAWGFFMPAGSIVAPATALASPGLTFTLNGTALPVGSLQTLTGTATYTGGLISNTFAAGGYQTGQFAQTWNFGSRSGSLNAIFDGSTWRGVALAMPSSGANYAGVGTSTTDQRVISIGGLFYNSTPLSAGSFPSATGGTFLVGGTSMGRSSMGGIFVGTRR